MPLLDLPKPTLFILTRHFSALSDLEGGVCPYKSRDVRLAIHHVARTRYRNPAHEYTAATGAKFLGLS